MYTVVYLRAFDILIIPLRFQATATAEELAQKEKAGSFPESYEKAGKATRDRAAKAATAKAAAEAPRNPRETRYTTARVKTSVDEIGDPQHPVVTTLQCLKVSY